jgi:hypothetical protein
MATRWLLATPKLTHLLSALSAVAQGGGRLFLLSGEPGIDKTWLARLYGVARRRFRRGTARTLGRRAAMELAYLIPDFIRAIPRRLEGAEAQLRLFRGTSSR